MENPGSPEVEAKDAFIEDMTFDLDEGRKGVDTNGRRGKNSLSKGTEMWMCTMDLQIFHSLFVPVVSWD